GEIARHGAGYVADGADALDRARHVGRALGEARDEVGGHGGTRALPMRRSVRQRLRACLVACTAATERLAHGGQHGVARGAIVVQRIGLAQRFARRTNVASRSMPRSIASFDAAYENRMCCPSPGTRRPKWMSASTAMPASVSRRLRNASESAQPVMRHASVTLGHA